MGMFGTCLRHWRVAEFKLFPEQTNLLRWVQKARKLAARIWGLMKWTGAGDVTKKKTWFWRRQVTSGEIDQFSREFGDDQNWGLNLFNMGRVRSEKTIQHVGYCNCISWIIKNVSKISSKNLFCSPTLSSPNGMWPGINMAGRQDDRYKHLIGRDVLVPIQGGTLRVRQSRMCWNGMIPIGILAHLLRMVNNGT